MGTFVERARTFVERARTHLACVTDASIGKGISISDHWCKGVRYARYASGGSGAYRTCVGLQRGAS